MPKKETGTTKTASKKSIIPIGDELGQVPQEFVDTMHEKFATQAHEKQVAERKRKASLITDEPRPISEGSFADRWLQYDESVYNEDRGVWMRFDNGLWVKGDADARKSMRDILELSVQIAAQERAEVNTETTYNEEYLKLKRAFDKANTIAGALRISQVPERIIEVRNLDSNPDTIGLPDCSLLELNTGKVREAIPNDKLSRRLYLEPDTEHPPNRWLSFLDEALAGYGDEAVEVKEYIRMFCGYMLTGHTQEEAFLFAYGQPGTGKSTFAETLGYIMGDYAVALDGNKLASKTEAHRQWLTRLAGARLAKVAELPQGGRWNATDLNAIISGEPIVANYMRQNDFEFTSIAKLVILGNFKPRVDAQSGIFRRMKLLDLDTKPVTLDRRLRDKLKAEGSRILGWMVNACADWYKYGLPAVPKSMLLSVDEYQRDQNSVAQFVGDQCRVAKGLESKTSDLYGSYKKWCEKGGYTTVNLTTFGNRLRELGYRKRESHGTTWRVGIALDEGLVLDDTVERDADGFAKEAPF